MEISPDFTEVSQCTHTHTHTHISPIELIIQTDGDSPSEVGLSGEVGRSLDLSLGKHHSLISGSFSGSVEFTGMEEGLRVQLKRIAKEINTRDQTHKDMRPPPVSVGVM